MVVPGSTAKVKIQDSNKIVIGKAAKLANEIVPANSALMKQVERSASVPAIVMRIVDRIFIAPGKFRSGASPGWTCYESGVFFLKKESLC